MCRRNPEEPARFCGLAKREVQFMKQRTFGKTGRAVSEIGLGTWQLGTRWGDPFNHEEAMKAVFGTADLAPYAIRWILMHPEVSVVIPGASKAAQVSANIKAAELPPLTEAQMKAVTAVYDKYLRQSVHPQW